MTGNLIKIDAEMDQLVSAFSNDDLDALMKMSGQSEQSPNKGLPRLNINYQEESDDGHTLKRGTWRLSNDGEFLYAPEVYIRPILRTFEWSTWDQEQGTFASKSVQKPTLNGEFPDSSGTDKCGRLPREQEEAMEKDDPAFIRSRSATCNQVIYGVISGKFTKADGTETDVEETPFVSYFKKSGFIPMRTFIDNLTKQRKIMQRCNILLRTDKKKMGAANYWVPVPTLAGEVDITENDKEVMKVFAEIVKSHNDNIMNQHRESMKLVESEDIIDLADDFEDAIAS